MNDNLNLMPTLDTAGSLPVFTQKRHFSFVKVFTVDILGGKKYYYLFK